MEKRGKFLSRLVDFVLLPSMMETPKGKSMTVPDEAMSIEQLFRNAHMVEGLDRGGMYMNPLDHDAVDLEKVRDMDLVDRSEAADVFAADALAKRTQLAAEMEAAKAKRLKSHQRRKKIDDLINKPAEPAK